MVHEPEHSCSAVMLLWHAHPGYAQVSRLVPEASSPVSVRHTHAAVIVPHALHPRARPIAETATADRYRQPAIRLPRWFAVQRPGSSRRAENVHKPGRHSSKTPRPGTSHLRPQGRHTLPCSNSHGVAPEHVQTLHSPARRHSRSATDTHRATHLFAS